MSDKGFSERWRLGLARSSSLEVFKSCLAAAAQKDRAVICPETNWPRKCPKYCSIEISESLPFPASQAEKATGFVRVITAPGMLG